MLESSLISLRTCRSVSPVHTTSLSRPGPTTMMPSIKRQASDSFSGPSQSLVKRQKSNSDLRENGALAVTTQGKGKDGALVQSVSTVSPHSVEASAKDWDQVSLTRCNNQIPRTSGLQAPILELTGHAGEVYAVRFDRNGQHIASGSKDRSISECNPL